MSDIISVENIGNVIILLAPGYLARQIYRAIFVKREQGDTPLLITSAVYSLPIVVLANEVVSYINSHTFIWKHSALKVVEKSTNWQYVVIVLVLALVAGYACVLLRKSKLVRLLLRKFDFSGPEPNIYLGVMKVDHKFALSAVTLKDGRTFAGILTQQQVDDETGAKALYFSRLRWPDTTSRSGWGPETQAAILVPLENVYFIQLEPPPIATPQKKTTRFGAWLKKQLSKLYP